MYFIESIKSKLAEAANLNLGDNLVSPSDFIPPPDCGLGDFSLPCFRLAGTLNAPPQTIASRLIGPLKDLDFVFGASADGPYLNIKVERTFFSEKSLSEIADKKDSFGSSEGGADKKIMVEFSNANTHKEYHVGHLRNLCFGDSIVRLLQAGGADAIPVSYINDFGINVAKTLWALDEFYGNDATPDNKGAFLGIVYARAAIELKKSEIGMRVVSGIMKSIESKSGPDYAKWKETRSWSIEQFSRIYQEMGIAFKATFYESELVDNGRELIKKLLGKKILEISDGATIANLEKYGLGVLVVLRSDGTALYPVADIALAAHKIKHFQVDTSIVVTDIRQKLYFKQLKKLLELLGFDQGMIHLGYEFVKLPTGMMSSRSGNIISYENLRDALLERAQKETAERHPDWNTVKIDKVSLALCKSTIKYEMLKTGRGSIITFDIEKSLKFDGNTAAYLLYTFARINSILKKSTEENRFKNPDFALLCEQKEHELCLALANYPEIVKSARENFNPSEIAKYIYELSRLLNEYYHSVQVLSSEDAFKYARLYLLSAASQVLKNGLMLLGINVIEEM
jgi:arginyl-tRNA synthetase